jgi:hypothetical protein
MKKVFCKVNRFVTKEFQMIIFADAVMMHI